MRTKTIVAGACLAAFVTAPLSAGAAALIDGDDIQNGSLTGRDVKNKSLTKSDFRGSVRGPRGYPGSPGPQGPVGPAGPVGPTGSAAPVNVIVRTKVDTIPTGSPAGL